MPKVSLASIPSRVVRQLHDDFDGHGHKIPLQKGVVTSIGPYKIENDVPVPNRRGKRNNALYAALAALDVGQSFLVPGEKTPKNVYNRVRYMKPKDFSCRILEDGVRVWRIS